MSKHKIVVVNIGSTSSKVAYYENDACIHSENIKHPASELSQFSSIMDQFDYRYHKITEYLNSKNIDITKIDCYVSRCGNIAPAEGGVYIINEKMVEQAKSGKYGIHATNIGLQIAMRIGESGPLLLTVDPPTTDEFEPLARYSGLSRIRRKSSFQALNQRAVGKRYAADCGKAYEDLNLIVIHMGGGISVVAHKHGRMVDANNALDGDGPFSTNRTGALPVGDLIDLCFSGQYTHAEMKNLVNGIGGLVSYVNENDVITIEKRSAEEPECAEVLEAMCYQVAKEVGAAAAVLKGDVDAILITGGMANSKKLTGWITERVSFIAPVHLYPGEFEIETLAANACDVLRGVTVPKVF